MELSHAGHVAIVRGAADVPFVEVADALSTLTDGYETRAVVLPLGGRGTAEAAEGEALLFLERYPIPLLAAVEDDVSGAAGVLTLGCDIRVARPGVTLWAGRVGSRRSLRLLSEEGSVAALERGGKLDAEAALAAGLVSALAEDPVAEALRMAAVIASRGPIATRFAKEAIWRGLELNLDHGLRTETDLTILLQSTKDRAEGVRAFIEKRAPVFTGD